MPGRNSQLPEAAFHILLALAQGERHGYAIMQEVAAGGVRMGPGTLYSAIKRLIEQHWIEEVTPAGADTRRRTYRITRSGRAALRSEAARLAVLVDRAVNRGVLPAPHETRSNA